MNMTSLKKKYKTVMDADYDILYGHTRDCDGNIESFIYSGSKKEGHNPPYSATLCGLPINFSEVKNWRYDPMLRIVFWWENPNDLEKEDVEYRLKNRWKQKVIGHDSMSSYNKSRIATALAHGYDGGIFPSFKDYMKYMSKYERLK